jgi:DNA-binding response OmpR family regulator
LQPTMLIVDDEAAVLFAMREYFTLRGYDVDCVRTGEEAGVLLDARAYTVVVADLRLTGTHGTEGLAILRKARECSPASLTVLLTAYGSPQVEFEARQQGVNLILHKPMPLAQVAQRITAPQEKGNGMGLAATQTLTADQGVIRHKSDTA